MPKSIPHGLKPSHVLRAIQDLNDGAVEPGFGKSTKWRLIYENREYPPKARVAVAFKHLTGNILAPDEFSSGEDVGQAVHELRRLGFIVDRINDTERRLKPNCWLLLEKSDATRISKGIPGYDDKTGTRYSYDSLVPNFRNLRSGDLVVIRKENQIVGTGLIGQISQKQSEKRHSRCTACASTNIRKRKNRRPEFRCGKCKEEFSAPEVTITPVTEFSAVIDDFTTVTDPPSVVAVKACSAKTGGIKSQLSLLQLDCRKILELIPSLGPVAPANGTAAVDSQVASNERRRSAFEFAPRKPGEIPSGNSKKQGQDPALISHNHKIIQQIVYDRLVASHSKNRVSCELPMASGNPADIVVQTAEDQYEIYEIKTEETSRECIRQAIGQLLEYAFWPRSPAVNRLFVVGPVKLDSEAENYLQSLISNFQLPIEYLYQPLED